MANYYGTTRTNYFSVTDEKKFLELCDNLVSEDQIFILRRRKDDGTELFGFGSYSVIDYADDNGIDAFHEELQKIIPDGEAVIITEVGSEKLRYLTGYSIIITKDSVDYVDLYKESIKKAQEMLHDDTFETDCTY